MFTHLVAFLAGSLAGFGSCYGILVVPLSRATAEMMRGRR